LKPFIPPLRFSDPKPYILKPFIPPLRFSDPKPYILKPFIPPLFLSCALSGPLTPLLSWQLVAEGLRYSIRYVQRLRGGGGGGEYEKVDGVEYEWG